MSVEAQLDTATEAVGTKRYIKVRDVAELTDIPTGTVYDLARQNRIPSMVRFGRHVRFDRDALERWLEAGGERDA